MTEYLVLVGLIALGLTSAVKLFGGSLELAFAHASARLRFAPTLHLGPSITPPPGRWVTPGVAGPARSASIDASSSLLEGEPIGSAKLSWSPPTANEDGSPANDLAGYRIYIGTEPGRYGAPIDVGLVSEYVINGLEIGRTYYFAMTAFDSSGNESALSNELAKTITLPGA